ncbi:DNL-type zinc finger protein [Selaginella moellendorffii]|nr:DNL-type zinc finger protein [Selaginella moellendorffii]|eukprot:XP_024525381.1 DNL-type zinc finger protein [Selaginella moellendorffii]
MAWARAIGGLCRRAGSGRLDSLSNRGFQRISSSFGQRGYCAPVEAPLSDNSAAPALAYELKSSLKSSPRHDLAMIYTCTKCNTRSAKTFSRETYDRGVVIVRCGGCSNLHLIADRLGMFGDKGSVEDFLAERGEKVKRESEDTYEFALEDLVGAKSSENSRD